MLISGGGGAYNRMYFFVSKEDGLITGGGGLITGILRYIASRGFTKNDAHRKHFPKGRRKDC